MSSRTNTAKWSEKEKRWRINVQKDGKRRSFYSSTPGRAGQREANTKADAWLESGITAAGMRIGELYQQFKATAEETAGTSAKRQLNYFGDSWILPALGQKKISSLCDQDIQNILDKAAAAGMSKKTIQGINGTINKFLKYCRRCKATAFRPEEVQIPASARLKGKQVLQPEDFAILFREDSYTAYGKRVKEEYIHAYRFMVLTGMRPGELRGLRLEDISGRRVTIRRAVNNYGETTRGKNENALRSFILSDMAKRELDAQLAEYPGRDYVFDMPSGEVFHHHWQRFCKSNGITLISPYELRHTFVSVVKRLPAGEVKPLVGHSENMDTFGVYSHELNGEAQAIADSVNSLFMQILGAEK